MPLELYGLEPKGLESAKQADIELMLAFNQRLFAAKGWLGRYQHLRNAIDLLWNFPRRLQVMAQHRMKPEEYDPRKYDAFIWNEWTELMIREFCETPWRTLTGPNSSWKTTSAAVYHLCAWFSSPHNSLVIVTSTSLDGLRARIWKEIVKYYRLVGAPFGNLVQSEIALQWQKGDLDAGIFGVATGQDGDVEKAVGKILGRHNTNTYAVVDEMQATNEALVKGAVSLQAGADKFEFTGLGNAENELDPHGQMSEPTTGWDSITPESERWETKRGVCIHLDGLRSPRVIEGDEFYPGLLKRQDIDDTIRDYGEDSPEFWSKRRGFWAPQGVTRTILSTVLIQKFHVQQKAVWVSGFKKGACLDPSFEGGDRCVFRFLRWGMIVRPGFPEIMALSFGKPLVIKVSATSQEPIHYQIVRQVKDLCEQEGVPPDCFALDTTGEGGGLASIFQREWSREIEMVEFGGRPSDRPVSEHNKKPENQEYMNQVTALWYGFRTGVQNDHVRDLDNDTCIEFCQRLYVMRGNLKQVETKAEMKLRTKKSPDLADNAVVGWELFRRKVDLSDAGEVKSGEDDSWRQFVRRNDTSDQNAYLIEA